VRLGDQTWPDVEAGHRLLVVPLGSCEQHGPHLPLDTDLRIAIAVGEALADLRTDVDLAPGVSYGSSGEHAEFPGTLSIGQAALELLVVELARSADAWRGVVLVNGHGGNVAPVRRAAARLEAEGRRVLAWSPSLPAADLHAGRFETSLLLAVAPERVQLDRAEPGDRRPLGELLPRLAAGELRSVSPNGILGDPDGASAAEGEGLLADLAADLDRAIDAWTGDSPANRRARDDQVRGVGSERGPTAANPSLSHDDAPGESP
jgi:creatinine amidohydrolase